jgi:DNA polymerase-3 subunit chi
VLINLSNDVPPYFSRFKRVAELVSGEASQRSAARERYRFYKDRGYTLNTHEIQ